MSLRGKRVYVSGSSGMVGNGLVRRLEDSGCSDLITRTSADLDLRQQSGVRDFFASEKPEIVIIAAARVGGILANDTYRAEFIYDNLMIEANLIDAAYRNDVRKLIFLGSSCIYPRLAEQPMKEEALLSGPLETTNEPYAIAKIAGIKLCENYYRQYGCNFFSVMPTNLYGPFDNFDFESSHVIPGLLRKFHDAKTSGADEVSVWGSGSPLREFMFVDDLADAVVFLAENFEASDIYKMGVSHINIGSGAELSIRDLAAMIKRVVGFEGEVFFDESKPDGTPRKYLDSSRLNGMGWRAKTSLEEGLKLTYDWFLQNSDLLAAAETQ
jgi:GDP-L-fucose synthase